MQARTNGANGSLCTTLESVRPNAATPAPPDPIAAAPDSPGGNLDTRMANPGIAARWEPDAPAGPARGAIRASAARFRRNIHA
jgi:hypothetical protein